MKRTAILALIAALPLGGPVPAEAHWQAGGAGSGQAPVATLPAGNAPSFSASLDTVTVQWPQSEFERSALGGYAGGGYVIRRYAPAGGPAVTPNGGCSATIGGAGTTLSCQETGVPSGPWKYTVTPVLGSWTGAESDASSSVTVLLGAPVLTSVAAQSPAGGADHRRDPARLGRRRRRERLQRLPPDEQRLLRLLRAGQRGGPGHGDELLGPGVGTDRRNDVRVRRARRRAGGREHEQQRAVGDRDRPSGGTGRRDRDAGRGRPHRRRVVERGGRRRL